MTMDIVKYFLFLFGLWLALTGVTFALIASNVDIKNEPPQTVIPPDGQPEKPDQTPDLEPVSDTKLEELEPPTKVNLVEIQEKPSLSVSTSDRELFLDNATTTEPISPQKLATWLNYDRQIAGLNTLTENSSLNNLAQQKLKTPIDHDTLKRQLSGPDYNFSALGILRVKGYIENELKILESWKNDPGSFVILTDRQFSQFGLAIESYPEKRGDFYTEAVVFLAKPQPQCRKPDNILKERINNYRNIVTQQYKELKELSDSLSNSDDHISDKEKTSLKEQYRGLHDQYTQAQTILRVTVLEYNDQVRRYNNCLIS